jgi:YHS domain.
MEIRPEEAVASELHEGKTFYFCDPACHETFIEDPHRWAHRAGEPAGHHHH